MAIRHVAAAALLVCASVAHADPLSATTAPSPSFLNNWTTGNGTDVLGSGVLGGSLNLVGGVSYGSASKDASLTDVLMGKASANIGQVDGQTQLFFTRGLEGTYLLAAGNGILAATLGDGKSVIGTADGALIIDGVNGRPVMTGGGNMQTGGAGADSGNPGGASQITSPGAGSPGSAGESTSGGTNTDTSGNANTPAIPGQVTTPGGSGSVGGGVQVELPGKAAIGPAEVPEPSSVALMLAGMLGAGALSRRRKQ